MSIFICPICKKNLLKYDNSYKCSDNHCYDISKSGYVNLLINTFKNSNSPGDNKIMVNARREFLSKGYYSKLSNEINKYILKNINNKLPIIDVGCGEGYYTDALSKFLKNNKLENKIIGIDISKIALDKASKICKDAYFAVSSIFHIPVNNNSCGILLNIFAPLSIEEFHRVLDKSGIFIMVIPGENHLWELKNCLYDNPYKNNVKDYNIDGFLNIDVKKVKYSENINNNIDIQNLFKMTPYYYKSSVDTVKKLENLKSLEITFDFQILIYKKLQ